MAAWAEMELGLTQRLRISRRPVAVAFRDTPPAGVAAFSGTEPSGCSFWRLAAAGRAFYTVPSDPDLHGAASGDVGVHGRVTQRRVHDHARRVAGRDLPRVAAEMSTIMSANDALADYHRERRRTLATE
jgi:hypothetical protein